jgi:AcrR family transcriptional regulator
MESFNRDKSVNASKPKWERKAKERPEALFLAALDVFSRHGYRASRLEDVAKAAGVSKGTVYNYFENKEDLLRKALEYKLKVVLALAETAIGSFRGTASEKLRFFMERGWNRSLSADVGRFHKLMLGEILVEIPELFRLWARKGLLQSWKLAEKIIREGQASGEFRAEADAAGAARFAMAGLSYQALLHEHMGVAKLDPYPAAGILGGAVDIMIRGLLAAGKPGGRKK